MQSNLRARRVAALCLFGSTARNEARPDLGDDPMCDFEEIRSISLFDVFYIEEAPADELGRKTTCRSGRHFDLGYTAVRMNPPCVFSK